MCGTEDYKTRLKKYFVQCCQIIFILLCSIFSRFLILFIYIINIRYWLVLSMTQEELGKFQFATSTFKCQGSTAAVRVFLEMFSGKYEVIEGKHLKTDSRWFIKFFFFVIWFYTFLFLSSRERKIDSKSREFYPNNKSNQLTMFELIKFYFNDLRY